MEGLFDYLVDPRHFGTAFDASVTSRRRPTRFKIRGVKVLTSSLILCRFSLVA